MQTKCKAFSWTDSLMGFTRVSQPQPRSLLSWLWLIPLGARVETNFPNGSGPLIHPYSRSTPKRMSHHQTSYWRTRWIFSGPCSSCCCSYSEPRYIGECLVLTIHVIPSEGKRHFTGMETCLFKTMLFIDKEVAVDLEVEPCLPLDRLPLPKKEKDTENKTTWSID